MVAAAAASFLAALTTTIIRSSSSVGGLYSARRLSTRLQERVRVTRTEVGSAGHCILRQRRQSSPVEAVRGGRSLLTQGSSKEEESFQCCSHGHLIVVWPWLAVLRRSRRSSAELGGAQRRWVSGKDRLKGREISTVVHRARCDDDIKSLMTSIGLAKSAV